MKRIIVILLTLALLLSCAPFAFAEEVAVEDVSALEKVLTTSTPTNAG